MEVQHPNLQRSCVSTLGNTKTKQTKKQRGKKLHQLAEERTPNSTLAASLRDVASQILAPCVLFRD